MTAAFQRGGVTTKSRAALSERWCCDKVYSGVVGKGGVVRNLSTVATGAVVRMSCAIAGGGVVRMCCCRRWCCEEV